MKTSRQTPMWRHGDVMIAAVESLPATAVARPGAVLAHGEATGHSHRIDDPAAVALFAAAGVGYLRVVAESARVVHQEHKPITLPRGLYRFWQQREYSPREIRTVRD